MQFDRSETTYPEVFFAIISLFLILLIAVTPWWVDFYETGAFFNTRRELLANIVSSSLNLVTVLLSIYFFTQRAKRQHSRTLELQRLSMTDHLTEIYNSRFFHHRLAKEIERANRQKEVFSLLFLDIDGFKRYNDSYGHAAGDSILKEVGQIILRMIREGVDCGARYGGDEFSVILIDTDLEAAMEIGERIRFAFHQHRNGAISLSMGVAVFKRGDTSERLLKRADDAMYRAKRKGGNQIESESGRTRYHKTA